MAEAKKETKPKTTKAKATTPELKPLNNTVKLPKEVFDVKINNQVMFDTVMMERASRRQGTHAVKSRADVSGTGKKP